MSLLRYAALTLLFALLTPVSAAHAQVAGDACTAEGEGAILTRLDNTTTPNRFLHLICDGGDVWREYLSSYGDNTGTKGYTFSQTGLDAGACTADKVGRLSYDPVANTWEFCDDGTWNSLASGVGAISWPQDISGEEDIFNDGSATAMFLSRAGDDNIFLGSATRSSLDTTPSTGARYNAIIGDNAAPLITTGYNNSILGYNAGAAITTSRENTLVGYRSGAAVSTGHSNVFLGARAGQSNTGGFRNTVVGTDAFFYNTAGDNNVVLGYAAGASWGRGGASNDYNVLIGLNAGFDDNWSSTDSGTDNIYIGRNSGSAHTSGDDNILLGYNVNKSAATDSYYLNIGNAIYGVMDDDATSAVGDGAADLTIDGDLTVTGTCTGCGGNALPIDVGSDIEIMNYGGGTPTATFMRHIPADFSLAIGEDAGAALDDANDASANTLIGYNSGVGITTGTANTFLGYNTGTTATVGDGNTFIGSTAGQTVVNQGMVAIGDQAANSGGGGFGMVAIGQRAGQHASSTSGTVAVGNEAGRFITGSASIYIGRGAGRGQSTVVNNTGSNNVYIGENSGVSNTSGGDNVAIGFESGFSNTASSQNVLIGYRAGASTNLAGGNTALGYLAGENATGGGNTFLGRRAGSATTSGIDNVFIGTFAGDNNTIGSRNIIIGEDTDNLSNSTSGFLNIGGAIYGQMDDDTTIAFGDNDADITIDGNLTVTGTCTGCGTGGGGGGIFALNSVTNVVYNTGDVATEDFVFGSTQLADTGNVAQDYRMFFDKSKAAFRAGRADNDEWDDVNVGDYSTALGMWNRGIGLASFAFGRGNFARGNDSFAGGFATQSNNAQTFSYGTVALAEAIESRAIGHYVTATGDWSTALGYDVRAGDGTVDTTSINIPDGTPGEFSIAFGMGDATGTAPQVSGVGSFGIFTGDQSGYDLSQNNTMAFIGGKFMIDDAPGGESGCIRFSGTALEFANDCDQVTPTWTALGGGGGSLSFPIDIEGETLIMEDNTSGNDFIRRDGINNLFIGTQARSGSYNPASAAYNTVVGEQAGEAITTGGGNSILGYEAGVGITTGAHNNLMGYRAGQGLAGGSYNTFIGGLSGSVNTANFNNFIGYESGRVNTTGANNNFFGYQAGRQNTTGELNTFIGGAAGFTNRAKDNNTAIGYESMRYADDTTTSSDGNNTAVGYQALRGSTTASANTGAQNTAVGSTALYGNTTGNNNAAFGTRAGYANTTGTQNTFLGTYSGQGNTTGIDNVFVGFSAGGTNADGNDNVFVGRSAGQNNTSGSGNVAIGEGSGTNTTTGNRNITIGYGVDNSSATTSYFLNIGDAIYGAMDTNLVSEMGDNAADITIDGNLTVTGTCTGCGGGSLTFPVNISGETDLFNDGSTTAMFLSRAGTSNLFMGSATRSSIDTSGTGAQYNTTFGEGTGAALTTGDRNTMVGYQAGNSITTPGSNTFLGYLSGRNVSTTANNTFVGASSGENSTGSNNTFVGANAGRPSTGQSNVAVGQNAGLSLTTASYGVLVGTGAGASITTGGFNTFIGNNSGQLTTTGQYNVGIGRNTLLSNVARSSNTAIGYGAMQNANDSATVSDSHNVAIGFNAMRSSSTASANTGINNIGIGSNTGFNNTSGYSNIFVGYEAGYANTTGNTNTFVGQASGRANTSGNNNAFYGDNAGRFNEDGVFNTFLGAHAGYSNTSGGYNTFIGRGAGTNNETGTQNIAIGFNTDMPTTSTNNYLNIGNAIVGTLDPGGPFDSADITIQGDLTVTGTCTGCGTGGGGGGIFALNSAVTPNVIYSTGNIASDDFVFGSSALGDIGPTGDYRFFYDKSKAAFRAGVATDAQWDDVNVGIQSAAFGANNTVTGAAAFAAGANNTAPGIGAFVAGGENNATGDYSFAFGQYSDATAVHAIAMGNTTTASGISSVAMGVDTVAGGEGSFAAGKESQATGDNSFAFGELTLSSGGESVAMGINTTASGPGSVAMGSGTTASGGNSFAMGTNSAAAAIYSTAIGAHAAAQTYGEISLGLYPVTNTGTSGSYVSTDVLFEIGNGTGTGARSNAITVLKNGNTTIGGSLNVGSGAATGSYSIASGNSTAGGLNSAAFVGASVITPASYGFAAGLGASVTASSGGVAIGTGAASSGINALAFGSDVGAQSGFEISMGRFPVSNTPINASGWNANDVLFELGNGTGSGARSNALTILKNGNLGIGTVSPDSVLHVDSGNNITASNLATEGWLQIGPSNDLNMRFDRNDIQVSNNGSETHLRLNSYGGNVGIGMGETSPNATLDVSGDIEYTGTIADVSDRRLKENLVVLDEDGALVDALKQVKTYSFNMIGEDQIEYGVVAQEVEELFPALVNTADDEMGTKSVNYMGFIPVIIDAVQDLFDKIASLMDKDSELEARLAQLEAQNAALLERLEALETK